MAAAAGSDFDGYLANLTPEELAHSYGQVLPETLKGEEFITRFGATADTVTTVEPSVAYRVREPTEHPVHEHARLRQFSKLWEGGAVANAERLGELMYQSHASYSACGLGSEGTDRLVELARELGPIRGIFGAKITGGGSGGTVAVLSRAGAEEAVKDVAAEFRKRTGHAPHIFSGSSPGAAAFGCLELHPA